MSKRLAASLAAALVIGLVAAGCGGGGSGDGTTASTPASTQSTGTTAPAATTSITKAQFIKEADAICTKGGKQSQSEFNDFLEAKKVPEGKEPTSAQFVEIGEEILVPALQQQVDEIRRLGIPPGDEAEITGFLDAIDEAIEAIEEKPELAKNPSKALADADKTIEKYGFKVCG